MSHTTTSKAHPATRGRAVVLRIEPPEYRCLDPVGLPSLVHNSPPLRGVTVGPVVPAVIARAAHPVAGDRALAEGRQEYLTAL